MKKAAQIAARKQKQQATYQQIKNFRRLKLSEYRRQAPPYTGRPRAVRHADAAGAAEADVTVATERETLLVEEPFTRTQPRTIKHLLRRRPRNPQKQG